jgi:hypothetical protein
MAQSFKTTFGGVQPLARDDPGAPLAVAKSEMAASRAFTGTVGAVVDTGIEVYKKIASSEYDEGYGEAAKQLQEVEDELTNNRALRSTETGVDPKERTEITPEGTEKVLQEFTPTFEVGVGDAQGDVPGEHFEPARPSAGKHLVKAFVASRLEHGSFGAVRQAATDGNGRKDPA